MLTSVKKEWTMNTFDAPFCIIPSCFVYPSQLTTKDSNTNGAVLAEYFKAFRYADPWNPTSSCNVFASRRMQYDCKANDCKTKVIGTPKTIDGDLKCLWQTKLIFGFKNNSALFWSGLHDAMMLWFIQQRICLGLASFNLVRFLTILCPAFRA